MAAMLLSVALLSCATGEFVEDGMRRRSSELITEAYQYWDADWDKVVELASRAIEVDPQNAKPYAVRGMAYAATDQYGRAMVDLDVSIKLSSDYPPAIITRAIIYMKFDEIQSAKKDFQLALELAPGNITSLVHMAEIYSIEGKPNAACQYMKKAIVMGFRDMAVLEVNPNLENMRLSDCYYDVIGFDAEGM